MRPGLQPFSTRRDRGFSLVELIVVIFLMVLLLWAVMPGVGDWLRNVRVRSTAESLASGINRARTEAIKQNKPVTFWLVQSPGVVGVLDATCERSATSSSWVVSLDNPAGACNATPSGTVAPRIISTRAAGQAGDGVVISSLGSGDVAASAVTFNGFGQPVSGLGGIPIVTIDVTVSQTGARRLRIVISSGGDLRMCDRDVSSTDPRRCL